MSNGNEVLRVVSAAIRDYDGKIYTLDPPARHHNIIHTFGLGGKHDINDGQGFMLSDGRYARRRPAWSIAERAGQLREHPSVIKGLLFSEDLW